MRHQIIHFLNKSIQNRFNRIFLVFQYYVLLWNYKKSFANNGYHKNLFSKRMVSIRKHFLQGLIEKKYCLWLDVCVSHPVKKFLPIPNRQGINWDIFLIFFDIRNPRLLLSHLHENFREKWFLEKKMYRLLQLLPGSDVGGVRIFSYDNWWLWDEDEHNIYGKSFCQNCIFRPKVSRLVQWHHHEVSTPNEE